MEIRYLEEFICLAKVCNYQDAAQQLHLSQSTLSKHIKALEKRMGTPLFKRTTRSVELNDFGKALLPGAQKIVKTWEGSVHMLNDMTRRNVKSISVAFMPGLNQYRIIETIGEFQRKHSEIEVNLIESEYFRDLLEARQCEFVFAPEDAIHGWDCKRIVFDRDCLAIVMPNKHPLAGEDFVSLEKLKKEHFVEHKNGHEVGMEKEAFIKHCREKGFTPRYTSSALYTSTIIQMVAQGTGLAAVYRKRVPSDISGISIVDIAPEIPVKICAYYLHSLEVNEVIDAFIRFLKERRC